MSSAVEAAAVKPPLPPPASESMACGPSGVTDAFFAYLSSALAFQKPDPPKLMDEFGYAYREIHGIAYPPFAHEGAIDELRAVDWSREGDVMVAFARTRRCEERLARRRARENNTGRKNAHSVDVYTREMQVATYPKCGTTWIQQIILLLLANGSKAARLSPPHSAEYEAFSPNVHRATSFV